MVVSSTLKMMIRGLTKDGAALSAGDSSCIRHRYQASKVRELLQISCSVLAPYTKFEVLKHDLQWYSNVG